MGLIDISQWSSGNQRFVPIGKRIKKVVLHPDTHELYYFKEPKEKYPWEFWNEIIAYGIGKALGFNILRYEPAILDGIGGCLSKSMTESSNQELIHGQQLLLRINPEFETKKGTDHTFQLVERFFNSMEKDDHRLIINNFIEMLYFDAIIGNRDRHQQNWAIIREVRIVAGSRNYFSFKKQSRLPIITRIVHFSPLFDNGNCLAYNIIEGKLENLINDEVKLEKYLFGEKAVSHLKWYGIAMPHIELLKHIYEVYPKAIVESTNRVNKLYNDNLISDIVSNIDYGIIFGDDKYKLSKNRKELICKLIICRINKLLQAFL